MVVVNLKTPPDWLRQCIMGEGRTPKPIPNVYNAVLGLSEDPSLRDLLEFNEMQQKTVFVNGSDTIEPINDDQYTDLQKQLQRLGLKRLSREVAIQAIENVSRTRSFHPVRNYLEEQDWDGIKRLDTWLSAYLGAELNETNRGIGRMFLISMVARIYKPGCKCDYMLVLEGPQGDQKSEVPKILGGEWFSDHLPENLASKDASVHLTGRWVIEIAEMHQVGKAEATLLKSFITRTHERYRPPYGRAEVDQPRQCVFIGTSNKDTYLKDETGGRRFWPVKCGEIQIDALARARSQLLAEALQAFRDNEPWWPSPEWEAKYLKPEQDARYETDIWFDEITRYLYEVITSETVTVRDIAKLGLAIPDERMDSRTEKRIVSVLLQHQWTRAKSGAKRYWRRPLGHLGQ